MNEATTIGNTDARSSFEIYRARGTTPEIRMTVLMVLIGRRWRAVLDDNLRAIGQSSARMEALAAIINSPSPSSQSDIARRLRIEGPTMTRMIDSLTRDGLVERRAAPGDRRTKLLAVTGKGERALEEMFAIADPLRERMLEGFTPDDVEHATAFAATILGRLDSGLSAPAGDEG